MEENKAMMIKKAYWDAETNIRKLHLGELDDILGIVGAPYDEQMNKRKRAEFSTKENIVKREHIGKKGNSIAITPTRKGGEDYFLTKLDGKSVYCKTYEGMIDKLYYHYGGDALRHSHSVAYYFGLYIQDYSECNPGNEKTIRNNKADYARFVDKELAKMDVRDVTPKYLETYSKKLITRLSLKVSAFKNFKSLLNNIFSAAIENMVIYQNPAKGMNNKPCYALCDQTIKSDFDYDEGLISEKEMEKIEAELNRRLEYHRHYKANTFYFYDIMTLLHAEIGCRPGELCALKTWDVKAEDLHIHAMIDADGDFQQFTKNEKGESKGGRLFPLTPKALALLDELQARREQFGIESEFLFCYADGRYILPGSYEEFIRNVFNRAGLPCKTSYAFRRTVNNRLEEAESTPSERACLLGHTPDTNIKHYTNPRKQATLTKFRNAFCVRSTYGRPNNVIEFKSKKPKNREFSGFSKTTISAGSRT